MSEDLYADVMTAAKARESAIPDVWLSMTNFEDWLANNFVESVSAVRETPSSVPRPLPYVMTTPVGTFTVNNVGDYWLVEMERAIPEEKFRTLFAMWRVEAGDE